MDSYTPTIKAPNIQPGMVLAFGGEFVEEANVFLSDAEVISVQAPAPGTSDPYMLLVSPEDGFVPELLVSVNAWRALEIVG